MGEQTYEQIFTAIGTAIRLITTERHKGDYTEPLWGRKNSLNLKNRGMVIGYKDVRKSQWYRVDFDHVKGLHINWEQDAADCTGSKTRLKWCYRIQPHIISPEDEMYTWWRSATLHHTNDLPDDIKALMNHKTGRYIWRGAYWSET